MQSELVSVVVPAFNAEATLARTLTSIRRQTYENLEIIVVDDGSTDGTRHVAEAEARQDPRIRVLSKPNGGVAEARNAGIRASRGALVAPIDADDLWHPEKIAKQIAVFSAGGPAMGFVYTYFRIIDAADNVLATPANSHVYEGHVFLRHLLFNFVGNGSALLMRREAFEDAGGYEPELQRQGAQGCEDYLLQLLIARSWTVGVVPEYLTGYRWQLPGAMSTDRERMSRSLLLMLEHLRARVPDVPRDVLAVAEASSHTRRATGLLYNQRRPLAASKQFLSALRAAPAPALSLAVEISRPRLSRFLRRHLRLRQTPQPLGGARDSFLAMDPTIGSGAIRKDPLRKWLRAFADREEAYFRSSRTRTARPDGEPDPAPPQAEARIFPGVVTPRSAGRR